LRAFEKARVHRREKEMRRSKALIISVVAIAVVAAVAIPSVARMGHAERGMDRGMGMGPVFTEEQREQMQDIHERYGEREVELANRVRVLRMEMQELAAAEGEPDFGALERKLEEIAEVRLDMAKLKLRIHQDIRPLLTDDQKTLFDGRIGQALMHGRGAGPMCGGRMGHGMGMDRCGGMGMCAGGRGGGMGAGARGRPSGQPRMMMRQGMPGCVSPISQDDAGMEADEQ
jgi:Spy/CpxP family protein refolding chaperone